MSDFAPAWVHPRVLDNSGQDHAWALGAVGEFTDNSLDSGATRIRISADPVAKTFTIGDDGSGMGMPGMHRAFSIGHSSKDELAGSIGRYGQGLKSAIFRFGTGAVVTSVVGSVVTMGLLSKPLNADRDFICIPMGEWDTAPGQAPFFRGALVPGGDETPLLDAFVDFGGLASHEAVRRHIMAAAQGTSVLVLGCDKLFEESTVTDTDLLCDRHC